jgi:proteic killer suppression protein
LIRGFRDRGAADIFAGRSTKAARRTCPVWLWPAARRRLELLESADRLDEIRQTRGNRLEILEGDRWGQHSIRVNDQYRICFTWTARGPYEVEIVDYHD